MYSSDLETAVAKAEEARELGTTYFAVWLPVAMHALAKGDLDAARAAYASMADTGARGASAASLGLADLELLMGNFGTARTLLQDGIASDEEVGNIFGRAVKHVALAEALLAQGATDDAVAAAGRGVDLISTDATLVPAALVYLAAGHNDEALAIATMLAKKLSPQSRAYAELIEGLTALESGDQVAAIEHMTAAAENADLWLVRFYLGRAYFEAGYFVEALDEFTVAENRHGEAMALFLDDLPTYRYVATLPYWQGRAQSELGMSDAASQSFNEFVARRPDGGPLADDARQRLP